MTIKRVRKFAKTCFYLTFLHDWGRAATISSLVSGIAFFALSFSLSGDGKHSINLSGVFLILVCSVPVALLLGFTLTLLRKALLSLFPGIAQLALEERYGLASDQSND